MQKGLVKIKAEQKGNHDTLTEGQIASAYNATVGNYLRENNPAHARAVGMSNPTEAPNIGEVVTGLKDPKVLNAFYNAINETSYHIFKGDTFSHPLARFKSAYSPLGGRIVKTLVPPAKEHMFHPTKNDSAFKRDDAKIIQEIHSTPRSVFFETTLQDTFTKQMVQSWSQFDELIALQMQSLHNGAILSEYKAMKKPLSLAVMSGNAVVKALPSDPDLGVATEDLQKLLKTDIATMVQQPTANYNVYNIERQPTRENVTIILTTEMSVNLDMDLFANLYNVSFADPKTTIVTIDSFADLWFYEEEHEVTQEDLDGHFLDADVFPVGTKIPAGTMAEDNAPGAKMKFDGSKLLGAVVSNDALIYVDQLMDGQNPVIVDITNPRSRSTNVYLHVQQILSYSPAENAVFYMIEDKEEPERLLPINNKQGLAKAYVYDAQAQVSMSDEGVSLVEIDEEKSKGKTKTKTKTETEETK